MHTRFGPLTLVAMLLLASCSQEAPKGAQPLAQAAPAAPVTPAATSPESSPGTADDGSGDDGGDPGPPQTEQAMYGYQFEVMPFPPPLGPNGETRTFASASTSAYGFTGAVTFSALPMPNNWDSATNPMRMTGANGLSYDLKVVQDGGVEAIRTIDWSSIMLRPIGMADYLKASANVDRPLKTTQLLEPGTLVFVFEVIKSGTAGTQPDAPGCASSQYIALTAPSDEDYLTIATFSPGPWPPADSSRHCGTFNYAPAKTPP